MKKKVDINELKNKYSVKLLKLSISIFFVVLFCIIFFAGGGLVYFQKVIYVNKFTNYDFQLHVIDVGQGDAFLLKFPNDKTMIIDTGTSEESEKLVSYVNQFLSKENLNYIDYLVLTHPDADHVGGTSQLLDNIEIKNLYRPKYYCQYEVDNFENLENYNISTSEDYNNAISKAYTENLNIFYNERGIVLNETGCKIEFLSPVENIYNTTNDYSAVIMITYQLKKMLFMGDASTKIENELISEYGDYLNADVLKIGHHGSKTSSSQEFLDIVTPEIALLSVDKDNSYNLPNIDIVNRLNDLKVSTISTAKNGNFSLTIKNDKIEVGYEQKPVCDMALILSITIIFILIIWGLPIKLKEKIQNQKNKAK